MSEQRVTIRGVSLTVVQVMRIRELGEQLGEHEWHPNECGCCVTVHRRGEHHAGYIIGSDGEYDWVEAPGRT